MSDLCLYFAPGSCSRVTLIALLETGAPFETALVRFMKGEHRTPEFLGLNPKGKVPALIIDGEALTENVAILSLLNQMFPAARLLPPVATALDDARQTADLCFCSATLHPLVTRIVMPGRFAGPEGASKAYELAVEAMRQFFTLVDERLASCDWWYGDSWSVMDAYLSWVFGRVEGAKFPVADYPHWAKHYQRMSARPSFQRALEIEAAATA